MIFSDSFDNVYKKIFRDHWAGFKKEYPWHNTPYYDDLIDKIQRCRNPKKMEYILKLNEKAKVIFAI